MSGANETVSLSLIANMDISQVLGGVKAIQNGFNGLKIDPKIMGDLTKEFSNLQGYVKEFQKIMGKENISKTDIKNLQNLEKSINSSFSNVIKLQQQLNGSQIMSKVDSSQLDELVRKTEAARAALNDAFSNIKFGENSGILQLESGIEKAVGRSKTLKTAFADAFADLKTGNVDQFVNKIDGAFNNLEGKLKNGKLETTAQELIKTFRQLGLINIDVKTDTAEQKIDALKLGFEGIKTAIANGASGNEIQQLIQNLEKATNEENEFRQVALQNGQISMGRLAEDTNNVAASARDAAKAEREFQSASLSATQQVQQLQQSTQYFFSLRNMINLLKRGVSEAVQTVKELDAAMTETAVVTDFSVGDMWEKLPEYTANANALGATVKDMYKSTTLYYQQGLDTEQSMGIAAETMKMARIGGLEAADATDKMTAALRGFNMELSEASAQRVNDVYSNLAAKTASDTEELGTAMQRTASIASSAGMSFEGTAAFLAQAIETTREPAENLGTAMKTIVARFQELKKNPLEVTEVDGEEVSYNKVDTALQSIGVSLKDTNGQFRALDDVFLDISQRWDSLTQIQQRYIATTAAGSRQQSRFIAMMSDYKRTMQLMDYANNSAGASEEQFGKTLESLEAKLNRFKNAWKEFLMGIMNDSFTKGIVDGTTKALDIVNKLIDTLSFGNKGIQSVLSLFTAFTALKVAGRGANMLIGGLGGLIDPKSSFREGLSGGALGGQAARITNPIVKAIYSLIPHIDGKVTQQNQNQPYGNFKQAKQDLSKSLSGLTTTVNGKKHALIEGGKYSLSGVQQIFDQNGLNNSAQQKALFASFPGLKKNMTSALTSLMKESGAKPEVAKGLMAGFKQGQLTSKDVLQQSGLLTNFSKAIETRTKEDGQKAGQAFADAQRRTIDKETYKAIRSQGRKEGLTDSALDSYVTKGIDDKLNQKGSVYAKNQKVEDALVSEHQLTKSQQFANTIGQVGGALSSAGMSLQMFGSQLAITNPVLGEMVTQLGGVVTAAGSIPNMISSLVAGGPAVWAITGAVVALGGAFIAVQKQQQNIKEAAEEVTTNFKDTSKQTQDNIASLKAYRDELATLSKGVDQNGNNINLSDSDYNRYLEIVDDIAAINPEIIEGYNAQGHAIIANNVALEKTLALQTQLQKEATDTYLQEESLQKLINARNINKDYTQQVTDYNGSKAEDAGLVQNTVNPFANDVKSLAKQIGKLDDFDESILQNYGIKSLDALKEGEKTAVENFVQHREQIEAALSNSGVELSESVIKGFDTLGENQAAFEEAIQPVYEWLSTSLSQNPLFEELPDEIRPALQNGLKAIASDTSMSAKQMTSESKKLLNSFNNLTVNNNKYKNSLETVADAQEKFADTLNETEYKAEVQPAINSLNELKRQAESMGTTAGDAIAEYLENQIAKISNFAQEGGASLSEALNSATDDIAAAEGALEDFNKATEKDFWTAAEGMKSIYDKIFETYKDSYGTEYEKHTEGLGDATFWEGAKQLLNEKELTGGVDAVAEKIKKLEPILREGQEGVDSFLNLVAEHSPELKKLSGVEMEDGWFKNIPEEQWGAVAEELGISENLLTSMLNKARQFGLIDFDNLSKVREALATSENVLQGTSTDANGKKALYVKEDTMRAELAAAGYTDIDRQDAELAKLQKEQNIQTIKTLDNLPKETAAKLVKEDLNIKDFPQLVSTLSKTGDYNKDEILDMAEKAGFGDEANLSDTYDEIVQALENPELAEQTSELRTVNSQLSAIQALIANGGDPNKVINEGKNAEKERRDALYGSDGGKQISADSAAEMFAIGKNTNGDFLSVAEFETTREALKQSAEEYRKTADSYSELAKVVTDPQQKEDLTNLAQQAIKDAEYTEELIEKGTQYQSNREVEQQQKKVAEEEKYEKERQAWEQSGINYQDYKDSRDEGREQARNYTTDDLYKNNQLAQTYVDNLNQATADAFSHINPQAIASNPQMLNAAQILSETVAGKITPTPEDLNYALNTLGVKEGTPSYDAFMQHIQSKVQEYDKGMEQAADETFSSEGMTPGGFTINIDALKKALHLDKLGEKVQELFKDPEIPNIDPKTDGGFREKVQAKIKTWWDNLTKPPEVPEPASSGSQSENKQPTVQAEPTKYQVDNSEAISKTQELKDSAQETIDTINTPATMTISTPGAKTLKAAAKDAKKLQGAASGNKNFNVTASVSGTDKIKPFNAAAKEAMGLSSHSVSYTARTSGTRDVLSAVSAGQSFQNLYDKTVTYTTVHETINKTTNKQAGGGLATHAGPMYLARGGIASNPMFKRQGTDTIPTMLTPGEYVQNRSAVKYFGIDFMRKINHKDLAGALQSFGSAAKGQYGRLGPKGSGGLTLTGEKGFEIAWIPSESRSMILGTTGPQMLNLPSDAIVYTHEQSKKILKQKAIPAGSHSAEVRGSKKNYTPRYTTTTTTTTTTTSTSKPKKPKGDNNNNNNNGTGSAKDISNVAAISNIIVWWDNITRRADKTQRKADKNQKDYEKYLKNIQATLTKTGTKGKGNDFISNINKAKNLYQEQFDRAKTELKNLDRGTKAQRDARKTKSKKDDKTARRKAFNAEAGGAVQISYEVGKGNKKKTKNALINTAGYIQAKDNTYIINQKKLNKVTKKGGKRKALADALNKEINDRISKKNTAEDNIRKAQEALEQFSATLYETFFAWESELTQIWNITKKIEQAQSRSSRADKYLDLLESQLSAGLEKATSAFNQATISAYQKQLSGQVDTVKAQVSAINANQKAVQKAYSTSDEKTTKNNIQKRLDSNAKIEATATKKNNAKKKLNAAKADKKKQQAEIKKQNKIRNDKKATKAQKAAAKKASAKAKKQLKKDNKNITKYQKRYNTANKNYKKVASSNTALSATEKAGYQEYVKELNNQINIAKQAQKYLKPTQYADGTMDIEFNSDALETDKLAGKISKDMAEGINKYVTGITEAVDELNKAYEDLTSSLTELYKSLEDLRSEYADNADELVKVLDEQNQKELDKLKELNDSLTKALKDLLDEVKKRLDERRRQEDNAKTERDISQKQQRLAMLRADTAGGNQVEIAQLEKEIAEAQQNYQRSLEDQLLDRLQEQGDEAAKQRERQIELQETLIQSVNNIPLVESWLSELKTLGHTDKDEARRKELEALMRDAYRSANDYENQGSWRQSIIDTQFQSLFNSLDTFDEKETVTVDAINNTKTAIETVTTSTDNLKKTIDENNNSPKTPSTPTQTKPVTPATSAKSATSAKLVTNNKKSTSTGMGAGGGALSGSGGFLQDYNNLLYRRGNKTKTTDKYWSKIGKDALKAQINRGKKLDYSEFKVLQDLANTEALDWGEVLTAYINLKGKTNAAKSIISYFGKSPSDARKKGWKNAFGKNYPKYKYGGLADFTGPAWLDGTQSKPELVLNSTDTKNFLALKDVLSHALSSTSSINNSYGGDATYEININVDHINSDYDVDKITERVKRNIIKDSSYRNVTQVRKFR